MAVQELSSSSTRIAMPKIWQSRARSNSFRYGFTEEEILGWTQLTQTAKLWILVHVGIHDNHDVHLGSCAFVRLSCPNLHWTQTNHIP